MRDDFERTRYTELIMNKIALIFLGILIGIGVGIGGYIWFYQTSKSATNYPTQSTKIFKSSLVNLIFQYPGSSSYAEEDSSKNGTTKTGRQVYFRDATTLLPNFDATTSDFAFSDSVSHDLLPGVKVLDASTNFQTAASNELGNQAQSKSIAPGMHLVAGFNNIEMTTSFPIYLIVEPPKGSGLKYLSFYLGDDAALITSADQKKDDQGLTLMTDEGIKRIIALGLNEQLPLIKEKLAQAIVIAQTFTTTSPAVSDHLDTTVLTFESRTQGIRFTYPKAWGAVTENSKPAAVGKSIFFTFASTADVKVGFMSKDYSDGQGRGLDSYEIAGLSYANGQCTLVGYPTAVSCETVDVPGGPTSKGYIGTDTFFDQPRLLGFVPMSNGGPSPVLVVASFNTAAAMVNDVKSILKSIVFFN